MSKEPDLRSLEEVAAEIVDMAREYSYGRGEGWNFEWARSTAIANALAAMKRVSIGDVFEPRAPHAWQPIETAPKDGTPITVGEVCRYQPYKPEGRRQMKRDGRWQVLTDYGWKNAEFTPERWTAPQGSEASGSTITSTSDSVGGPK